MQCWGAPETVGNHYPFCAWATFVHRGPRPVLKLSFYTWLLVMCIQVSTMQEKIPVEKRVIKMLPSKRSLGMFPLCRDKRQIDISYHLFFYTCTICSITGKQTVRWDLADSAFEVLRCALIRDNLSTGLLWSPWAENEINAVEMTQLLQSNIHSIWERYTSLYLLLDFIWKKTATGRNHF